MRAASKIAYPAIALGLLAGVAPAATAAADSPTAGGSGGIVLLYVSVAGKGTCMASSSPCGLDSAVAMALNTSGDTGQSVEILLAPGTYTGTVLSVAPSTLASLTIMGTASSPTVTVLDGTTQGRVVELTGTGTFALDDVTVERGTAGAGSGGCIDDTTKAGGVWLHLQAAVVTDCTAGLFGGGVFVGVLPSIGSHTADGGAAKSGRSLASLSADGIAFSTDDAVTGGAIYVSTVPAILDDGDFTIDGATTSGGAVVASGSTLSVRGSTFVSDTADLTAGAIRIEGFSGSATISDSTFWADLGGDFAGAVEDDALPVSLDDNTFVGDRADTGGAVTVTYGTVTASFDTFSHDTGSGGAVHVTTSGTAVVSDSLFQTATCANHLGTFTDAGYNVASTASCATAPDSHHTSTTIDLAGTLASNTSAGPYTLAIGSDSSAFEEVPPASCTVTTDERGEPRPGVPGHACDAGAFEVQRDVTLTQSSATSATVGAGAGYAGQLAVSGTGSTTGPVTFTTTTSSPGLTVSTSGAIAAGPSDPPGTYTVAGTATANPYGSGLWTFTLTVTSAATGGTGGTGSTTPGYDMVGADGGVFVFNPPGITGGFFGSLPGIHVVPNTPVVGMVPTVKDTGYFLVGADGGVYAFGTAPFLGSLPGIEVTPNAPIVGIVAVNTDKGYFLVGADGGVYAFGTAPFAGSLPGRGITTTTVIGIAATPSGNGYWVVLATGTVHAFGAATAFTSTKTATAVSAIAGTRTGGGYWLATVLGRVYPYGNARHLAKGTLPALGVVPNLTVVGIVPTAGTTGYWLIGLDGGLYGFTAPYYGSLPGLGVHVDDIVGAVPN